MYMIRNIIRALRLPFITASVLPFIFGSLIKKDNFNCLGFLFGLSAVMATHLSANLINDYADSRTGADWQDRRYYNFFGGSKLIQEKVFSEQFFLKLAVFFAIISCLSAAALAIVLNNPKAFVLYLSIIFFSWAYSKKPFAFSYHRLGEVFIFMLFGPALVMGGYFIQAGLFPDAKALLLSLPFGFLTTAILFANEVPDFYDDKMAGKFTWVSLTGQEQAFVLYFLLIFFAFLAIGINTALGYLRPTALLSFVFINPAIKATKILKKNFSEKRRLTESSKLTIAVHTLTSIVLILSVLL
jgi:1,4-dihydroxy-2-naphthoate polyprenyltransferase